jgi:crossover junction endodeoxyribonuclease RusA
MPFLMLNIPGDPIAKGRPRAGKNGVIYTPRRTKDAEKVIKDMAATGMDGDAPLEGPLGIEVHFYCATKRRTDGDNLLKLVTDALNKVVYADDSQIVEYHATVQRGVGVDRARTAISVYVMDELGDGGHVRRLNGLDRMDLLG